MEINLNFNNVEPIDDTSFIAESNVVCAFLIEPKTGKAHLIVNTPNVALSDHVEAMYMNMVEGLSIDLNKLALVIESFTILEKLQSTVKKASEDKQDS